MEVICSNRIVEERKQWRKDHPFGFYAKPVKKDDGTLNLMQWTCGIPGKENTPWENGLYTINMVFDNNYPVKPPKVSFQPPIFHPNVYSSGEICLSILNEYDGWKPSISIKQILIGVQELLTDPNPKSPANGQANQLLVNNKKKYEEKIKMHVVLLKSGRGTTNFTKKRSESNEFQEGSFERFFNGFSTFSAVWVW
ncbi:E2 SUMO-conjugating protein ubc9 [Lobulomyces angularis]|nr:E2 SUMO-conjugating protein ubc9 [Lobulomyces angularis]